MKKDKRVRRLYLATFLMLISILAGVTGYHIIEGFSFTNAFYMTVLTISTVGFGEVEPLSESGKLFASFFIIFNLGVFAFSLSVVSSYVFEGGLTDILKKYKTHMNYKKLNNHVIVCGYGRNGVKACAELKLNKVPFVVIDSKAEVFEEQLDEKNDFDYIIGDATHDEILKLAGIDKAKSIIAALDSDATNVFITLTARELNSKVNIIARASETSSESKLYRAGANSVVMPDAIGGHHMASLVTKPAVIEFIGKLNGVSENSLNLEEFSYEDFKEDHQGKSIKELEIRKTTGVTIIAMKRKGFFDFNPSLDTRVEEGIILIAFGKPQEFLLFKKHYTLK